MTATTKKKEKDPCRHLKTQAWAVEASSLAVETDQDLNFSPTTSQPCFLGTSLHLSEPQFSHLWNRDDDGGAHLLGAW